MPLRKNPKVLGWVETFAAIYGFHGVGWLAAGFFIQGMVRMIADWILFIFIGLLIFILMNLFGSFLRDPYFLMPALLPVVIWRYAAIRSGIRLRGRLQRTKTV